MTFTCIQVVTCIPSRVKVFQIISEENSFLPPKKRGKFVSFTVTIGTQDVMKSAWDEVSPVSWPGRLCLLQRFCSVFTTLLYYAHHLLQPFPYLLAQPDLSPHLTLSFHTSHSQFFSSALKDAFTDC